MKTLYIRLSYVFKIKKKIETYNILPFNHFNYLKHRIFNLYDGYLAEKFLCFKESCAKKQPVFWPKQESLKWCSLQEDLEEQVLLNPARTLQQGALVMNFFIKFLIILLQTGDSK